MGVFVTQESAQTSCQALHVCMRLTRRSKRIRLGTSCVMQLSSLEGNTVRSYGSIRSAAATIIAIQYLVPGSPVESCPLGDYLQPQSSCSNAISMSLAHVSSVNKN